MATNKKDQIKPKRRFVNVTLPRDYSIGFRFVSFLIVALLLCGVGVGLLVASTSRNYLRQQSLQNNLNQATLAASYASNYIAAIEAHVKVFATRPDIVQAILNGTASQLQPTLTSFIQLQTSLNGVGITNPNGILLTNSTAGSTTIGQSYAGNDWFQEVVSTKQPYLSLPKLAQINNIPIETYAVPILDDHGQIIAILSAGISLKELSNAIVNIGYNTTTQAVLIDTRGSGLIIANKNPALLLTPVAGDNQAINQVLAGGNGSLVTTGSNGKQDLTGFAAVTGLPWGILVITPSSSAYSILNSLMQRASIYVVLIVLLSVILGVLLVLSVTRPLNRLIADTKIIGSGNLDIKLETNRKDEVGALSRAFNDMTNNLKTIMVSRDELAAEVSDRKQAEEKLRETNEYLENLFNYANAPIIVWNNQFTIVRFNHAFEVLTGRAAGDVVGKSIDILFPPSQKETSMDLIRATTTGERWDTAEISILRQDGSLRTVLWNSASVLASDGKTRVATIAQGQDITVRIQSLKSLKESEERYRTLFESAIDGILIADLATRQFKYANPSICEMLGYTQEELTRMGVMDIHPPESIEDNLAKFGALARGELKMVTVPCLRKDRTIIFANISAVKAIIDGKECNIGFFDDVTERRLVAQEREKIAKELAEKNTELERFTYTVSHDLKSPLVTVKTFLGYLKHDIAAADPLLIEKDMLFMNSAADKMGKLLEELLEMSRVGRIANLPVNVTFNELIEDTLGNTAGRIEEKGVKVRLHKEPVTLFGDRTRLVEIWQNLVENAVKFMGDQPAPQIDIGVEQRENGTVFFVRDNGIGIEPKYQAKLFNLFEKLNPKMEGTGMGLAIAKRIVELYQGKIWVESKGLGEGTCFFFTLPGALKDKKKGV